MFTPGFKLYAGVGALFLLAAVLYAWTSGGVDWGLFPDNLGTLYYAVQGAVTAGWRGGVGDHLGYVVLLTGAGCAFTLGCVLVAFRDTDAKALAEVGGHQPGPPLPRPRARRASSRRSPRSAWPLLVLGLVTTQLLWWAGLLVLGLAALEWTVRGLGRAGHRRRPGQPAAPQPCAQPDRGAGRRRADHRPRGVRRQPGAAGGVRARPRSG